MYLYTVSSTLPDDVEALRRFADTNGGKMVDMTKLAHGGGEDANRQYMLLRLNQSVDAEKIRKELKGEAYVCGP